LVPEWDDNLSVILGNCGNIIQSEENGDNKGILLLLFATKKCMFPHSTAQTYSCNNKFMMQKCN
jgi:hypothetical protein